MAKVRIKFIFHYYEEENKKIVIVGATGGSAEVGCIIKDINSVNYEYEIICYLDDNKTLWGQKIYNIEVMGGTSMINNFNDDTFFISGIGSQNNFIKKPKIINDWAIDKKICNNNSSFSCCIALR